MTQPRDMQKVEGVELREAIKRQVRLAMLDNPAHVLGVSERASARDHLAGEHADAILALLTDLASGAEGWRPIETAPKQGGPFLAAVDGDVRLVAWGKTSHVPIWGFCLADQGVEDFDLCAPTHWMPLPAAPTTPPEGEP